MTIFLSCVDIKKSDDDGGIELLIKLDLSSYNQISAYFHPVIVVVSRVRLYCSPRTASLARLVNYLLRGCRHEIALN